MSKRIFTLARNTICFLLLTVIGCKDKVEPNLTLSNLQVAVEIDSNANGQVSILAKAENATYYQFRFFEKNDTTSFTNSLGEISYNYTQTGAYSVLVQAFGVHNDSLEQLISLNVIVRDTAFLNKIPKSGYSTPLTYPNYTLVWSDEFDGEQLSDNWNYDIGGTGWGNNELQYYTNKNTQVKEGYLVIEAKKERFSNRDYTSTRLTTLGKKLFTYGRMDIRAALPKGQGIWPAIWMLGENFPTDGWPQCGEIDIMEMVGGNKSESGDNFIHGNMHWFDNGYKSNSGTNKLAAGIYADEFHVFSIVWDKNKIDFLRDDIKYHSVSVSPSGSEAFHKKFYFLLNVAVGGDWPGSPDATTEFPQQMVVDYVRVFQ